MKKHIQQPTNRTKKDYTEEPEARKKDWSGILFWGTKKRYNEKPGFLRLRKKSLQISKKKSKKEKEILRRWEKQKIELWENKKVIKSENKKNGKKELENGGK